MKKYLLGLLVALALFAPGERAHAGVTCSVPFNLQNGTTADASQVMANYNAILSCLQNNTAASGQNTDITALLGLTNPITPLCGATGFVAANDATSPNSVIDITANIVVNLTPSGLVATRNNVVLQLNFAASGVNGLDTGSIAQGTIYYIWLIDNGTAVASLASLSSTNPTLPTGYTYKCRVGAFTTFASSATLVNEVIVGNRATFTGAASSAFSVTATTTGGSCSGATPATVTFPVPTTARTAIGNLLITGSSGANVSRYAAAGTTVAGGTQSAGTSMIYFFEMPFSAGGTINWCNNSTSNQLQILGWFDSVLAN